MAKAAHDPALATPLPRVLRPKRALPNEAVRPTRAEINLASLRHNLRVVQRASQSPVWAVLKADAYGHGAKAVARTLERAGVVGICVALLEEAIELREAGIQCPILVMGGYYGGAWYFPVDALVVGFTPRRVTIQVRTRGGAFVERSVRAKHLYPREVTQ